MTENRVMAEGVHKAFGDNEVLKGVSFNVPQGTATLAACGRMIRRSAPT